MLETLISSFSLVAVSEMGDKTQLLAFSLAARFRKPLPIFAGIFFATVANHALAAGAGSWISSHIGPKTMAVTLGVLFIAFGAWTLKPDTLEDSNHPHNLGPFFTTLILFFIAEMGDKTQLATVALGARYSLPVWVTVGTTIGTADGAPEEATGVAVEVDVACAGAAAADEEPDVPRFAILSLNDCTGSGFGIPPNV
jgi:putative Ca2+/H+ antiporter (TMEM165/GDT1 family)